MTKEEEEILSGLVNIYFGPSLAEAVKSIESDLEGIVKIK